MASMWDSGWIASSMAREAAGDWRRSIPSQSWRASSAAIAVMRAGCSGWPPVSCSSEEGCSKITGGMSAVPYCSLEPLQTQVAVVGAGAAGLYTALCAARAGGRVTLISATPLAGSSSYWAQGGLAAAVAAGDSAQHHLADTLTAGRGAVRPSAAEVLCDRGAGGGRGPRGPWRAL